MEKRSNGSVIGTVNTPTTSVASGIWALSEQEVNKSNFPSLATPPSTVEYLVVAGGGAGGYGNSSIGGGGGGAGGYRSSVSGESSGGGGLRSQHIQSRRGLLLQ